MITTNIIMGSGNIAVGHGIDNRPGKNCPFIHFEELIGAVKCGDDVSSAKTEMHHKIVFYMNNEESIKVFRHALDECSKLLIKTKDKA